MNIALGGACLCESEVADFITARNDWDFLTLEVGVNMRNIGMPAEEFEKRVRYLLTSVLKQNPKKHVVILTMFPNSGNWLIDENNSLYINTIKYDGITRSLYKEMCSDYLHLIEGSEILTDFSGLSCDLLHPFDFGYIHMGENLANKLKEIPGLLE
jgi:lysophospholipase L1-like esterase